MMGWTAGEKHLVVAPRPGGSPRCRGPGWPRDQIRAGMAAETIWLAATDAGLVGSVLTQPFQLPEVRAGLVESLSLNGFPQLLLRFGHPRRLPRGEMK